MLSSLAIHAVWPEILVSGMACIILVLDLYLPKQAGRHLVYQASLATLALAAAVIIIGYDPGRTTALNGTIVKEPLSDLLKLAMVGITFFVFVYSRTYQDQREWLKGEYFVLGLFALVGMMIMSSAIHFITLYMGLELLSLCLYTMVAFQRDDGRATEAAMKYFVLGALASGILLYGLSLLYGLTGSLAIADVRVAVEALTNNVAGQNLPLAMALIFVIVALMFKIGAVPFHMWVPDVYEGSPTPATVFLAAAPKLAGFAIILRLLVGGLEGMAHVWQDMLVVVALLSIGLGNVIAIAQHNIKRMLAYSTISHMGFFLLGVLSASENGYSASLLYVLVYAVLSLGAFGVILLLSVSGREITLIEDLRGLNKSHPWIAFLMLLLMFSLSGVPPTVGFYAKLSVLQAVVESGFVWVAVVAVIFAVIGAFYYLRIVKLMYFDEPDEAQLLDSGVGAQALLTVNALAVIVVMPWIGGVAEFCRRAIDIFIS